MQARFPRLLGSFSKRPLLPVALALILLVASLLLGIRNDRIRLDERLRASHVQAEILARSVAAPLAFDDRPAMREYFDALKANGNVLAAGAYGLDGALEAGLARPGIDLPKRLPTEVRNAGGPEIVWQVPVSQNGTRLGTVYLLYSTESWSRRLSRYAGIALLVATAALLIAAIGTAYASLSRSHQRLRDEIAQREKAEEALRQAQKMEAMGQLTGGVAHDFNNLLMVASSGLDLLDRTDDPARRERLKAGIRQAIDRGAKLTQQLLTFARRSPLKPEVIDVEQAIRGLQDLLERSLREDITVRMEFAEGLCPIEVDPSQFEVALLNVALNARDAMPEGGVIRIVADSLPAADGDPARVRIAIIDQGVGVDPADLEKVFEPFYTTKEVGRGTGLGLSQVYGFARAAGGEVRFESERGRGSTVSLLLPCSTKPFAGRVAAMAAVTRAPERQRLLLVEDDEQVATMVEQMLAELGYDCIRVADGTAALARLARDSAFDLVFSDMVMPGATSGLELAHEIGRRWPRLSVLLTSGYSDAAASAMAEGREILQKPYSLQTLGAKLKEILAE